MVGLVFLLTAPLLAGGIDNKHNFSAEYIRTLNRNAAVDSADVVVYNPAGVMQMENGFYLNFTGQYAAKDYSNTIGGMEYDSDTPDIVPSLFALYKKDKWAGFAAFTIPVGGGAVEYEKGSATTLSLATSLALTPGLFVWPIVGQYMEGESYYYGLTVGGAYAINDMVSVSLGLRYSDANIERSGYATATASPVPGNTYFVDYEETGDGLCGIIGLNLKLSDRFNIGVRFETETSLSLETTQNRDTLDLVAAPGLVATGTKRERNIPGIFGLGLGFQVTPKLYATATYTMYLNGSADWSDIALTGGNETVKKNGYDIGLALEYAFNPTLKGSFGVLYTETGIEPANMSKEAPELDAITIGGGIAYDLSKRMTLNFGVLKTFYQDETTTIFLGSPPAPAELKLEKDVMILSAGIQYRF